MWHPLSLLALLCLCVCLTGAQDIQDNCSQEPTTLFCRGERAIRNALRNLSKSTKPLVVMRGLEIVPMHNELAAATEAGEDASLLDSLAMYLRTHEVNLRLSDLLEERAGVQVSEARKKDKGQGMILAMAVMFGKMMAVLGIGGIGALAMKALGVAMVALMLAGMLGLKAAAQQGNETSHSISYVTGEGHHHKRRRRSLSRVQDLSAPRSQQRQSLPYRGWDY